MNVLSFVSLYSLIGYALPLDVTGSLTLLIRPLLPSHSRRISQRTLARMYLSYTVIHLVPRSLHRHHLLV